jgi:hypothetical protein
MIAFPKARVLLFIFPHPLTVLFHGRCVVFIFNFFLIGFVTGHPYTPLNAVPLRPLPFQPVKFLQNYIHFFVKADKEIVAGLVFRFHDPEPYVKRFLLALGYAPRYTGAYRQGSDG